MLDSRLLEILRCPETKQTLKIASAEVLSAINQKIEAGQLCNGAGRAITQKLSVALIREDGARVFPVVDGIPVMLLDESIPLKS